MAWRGPSAERHIVVGFDSMHVPNHDEVASPQPRLTPKQRLRCSNASLRDANLSMARVRLLCVVWNTFVALT